MSEVANAIQADNGAVAAPEAPAESPIKAALREAREKGLEASLAEAPQPEEAVQEPAGDENEQVEAPEAPEELEIAAEGDEEGENEAEPIVLALPGREPGSMEEWEVSDPELAEAIRRLSNGFARTEEHNRRMEAVQGRERELRFVEERLAVDPAGFILENVAPETAQRVVLELLADQDLLRSVIPQVNRWTQDPRELELFAMRSQMERQQAEQEYTSTAQQAEAIQSNTMAIVGAVESMIPEGADQVAAQAFRDDALRDLMEYAAQNNINYFPPEQVQAFLDARGRSRFYGFQPRAAVPTPNTASASQPRDSQGRFTNPAPAAAASATQPQAAPRAPAAAEQGKRFKEASARRRAAVVAPAGAAAASAAVALPKSTGNIRDTINAMRGRLNFGSKQ